MNRCLRALLLGALVLAFPLAAQASSSLAPRRVLESGGVHLPPLPPSVLERAEAAGVPPRRLVVKFADDARVRARADGSLRSLTATSLAGVEALAAREDARFAPLITAPEGRLEALRRRAERLSGRAQPDLGGWLVLELPVASRGDDATIARLGRGLEAFAEVELVHAQTLLVPPPGDIAPTTPDLTANQSYVDPDPGLDVAWARSQGYRGAGVRLSDCEYGWNPDHEDLEDIDLHLEPGQTIAPSVYTNGWDSHGTAVVGGSSAPDNGYGVTGIADQASVHTYTEWSVEEGLRRSTAVFNAIADSGPGDVVLLEMQTVGPGGGFAPAEVDPAIFTIVRVGTDAGVIVVGAAGNGGEDLDSAPYATYRSWGDSGAILVGAGSASAAHNRLSFSTFGSRVDVQGWGASVFTLGYGGFAQYGGDKNQRYTATFNGTSSASGLVAPACAVVQGAAEALTGARLSPRAMRALLVATGVPQGSGGHIGPLPDLRAAIEALPTFVHADFHGAPRIGDAPLSVAFTDRSFGDLTGWSWEFGDGATSSTPSPTHVYTIPGVYDVRLSVSGPNGAESVLRSGYVVVDEALAVTSVSPNPIPALLPGTSEDVTVLGADFDPTATVALDGVPLDPGSFTVVDASTITLDMPQLAGLGAHTLTVDSAGDSVDFPIELVAPPAPVLQVGNGEDLTTNFVRSTDGADIVCAGTPGDAHYVLYSSQDAPSVLPGLVSLDLGASFSEFDLATLQVIAPDGWTAVNLPFQPIVQLLYFQTVTFTPARPLPVSNRQEAVLLP